MTELAWYHYLVIVYASLFCIKALITVQDMSFVAKAKLMYKVHPVEEGQTERGQYFLMWTGLSAGAMSMLTIAVIPLMVVQGLAFFAHDNKDDLIYFAKHDKWPWDG